MRDEEEEDEEERKDFLEFPTSQSTPTSTPIRCPLPVPELPRPPQPTNGERRPRGRPPKNWPWGKVKNTRVGRPPKIRQVEDKDDEDEETMEEKPPASGDSPPSLFSLDRQTDSATFHALDMARHPSISPTRRGRPPRKKRGPKPRLGEEPEEGLTQLSVMSRLNDPVRKSCFSESSEEEEDEDDEQSRACSPPILTKPAMGLKSKVKKSLLVCNITI